MSQRLIIRAELVNPPSEPSAFRDLTLYVSLHTDADILIEVEPEYTDLYVNWMRPRGLLDFVEQIVRPNEESGVFIDMKRRHPRTIYVSRITSENVQPIVREAQLLLSRNF